MEAKRNLPVSIGLDEIVESRLRELLRRISEGSAQDLEPELTSLAKLVDSYNRKEELLEDLLDPDTRASVRQQIREALKIQQKNRDELQVLRTNSCELLQKSIQLFLTSSKKLYKIRNGTEYSPELCGYCEGSGRSGHTDCPACKRKRLVVVHQPAMTWSPVQGKR